jgi:hypothetical protein
MLAVCALGYGMQDNSRFSKLRFKEFATAAAAGTIAGAVALTPMPAPAATGSVQIFTANARWFVNTNITFSTTSSGSLALSSASLHTALAATAHSFNRNDAFDGALTWHVYGGTPPGGADSSGGYFKAGSVVSVTSNTVVGPNKTLAGLTVHSELFFSKSKDVVRSILYLQNPSGSDIPVTVDNDNNLGSDSNTSLQATSSGDTTFDPTDNWFVSCQATNLGVSTACNLTADPILTYAFQQAGALSRASSAGRPFANGNDLPNFRYSLTVPAGQTRAVMVFVQLSDTPAHAQTEAALFNTPASLDGTDYLTGLTAQVQSEIVNWNLPGTEQLNVALSGTGSGTVTSGDSMINCGSNCSATYAFGANVTLTATAAAGSAFAGWSGGMCSGSTDPCSLTVTGNDTETAVFNQIPSETLMVGLSGTGSGTVTSSPSGINCGSMCSANFQQGTQVTLTANPDANSTFAGWSGGGCSGTGTCVTTLNAAASVTATFTENTFPLTISETGNGSGQVTSNPAGINCSASSNQCSFTYNSGTVVKLTASASAGSTFAGWSGGGCSGTASCSVTMSAAMNVTANFTQIPTNMLTIAETGGGTGMVTSNPSGINCGSTCMASFTTGTQITLVGKKTGNSTFAGWSGGQCVGTQPCTLTLNADTTVTANFVANTAANVALLAAVLPDSRSVQVGATATAFATILNAGSVDGTTCSIAPAANIAATFDYQTTDPRTNGMTGTADTPVTVPAGGGQTFVFALTPSAAFGPTDIPFTFTCANAPNPAQSVVGLNTLNLSASTTPVPDIIAVNATGDPGYLDISPSTQTGAFAVATYNLGSADTITVGTSVGMANLPVTILVCQTNPSTGACVGGAASTVTLPINPGDTDTFSVFVTSTGVIPDMPAVNRVFVRFVDSGGTLRGETSVAVRTQAPAGELHSGL